MNLQTLQERARTGVYDLDPDFISQSGKINMESPRVKRQVTELKRNFRDDCILAAIDAGLGRAQARQLFEMTEKVAGSEGYQSMVEFFVGLIRSQL